MRAKAWDYSFISLDANGEVKQYSGLTGMNGMPLHLLQTKAPFPVRLYNVHHSHTQYYSKKSLMCFLTVRFHVAA